MLWVCCLIQATISSLNKEHSTDRLVNTARIQHVLIFIQPVLATHKFLNVNNEVISAWKGNIEKIYPLNMDFPVEPV